MKLCVSYTTYIFLIYLSFHPKKFIPKIFYFPISFLNNLSNVVRDISSNLELDTFYGFPIGQILEDSWIGPACISKQTEQAGNNWAKHFMKSQSKYE